MLPVWFVGICGRAWMAEQPMWLRLLMAVPAAVVLGAWLVLFVVETDCNAPTPTSVRFDRCTNRVRGLLSACGIAGHRRYKRQELLAALLRRPLPESRRPRRPAPRPVAPAEAAASADAYAAREQAPSWLLRETSYRAWTLGISAVGCLASVISTVAALAAIAG